jgi:hypothetical protein
MHTSVSPDGAAHPAELVAAARRKGLDRICITDHNALAGAQAAQRLAPDLVIVGEEILTARGDEILAFFVREWVPPRLSHAETLDRLEAQGAVISVAHPFDRHRNRPWTEELLAGLVPRLDAIEIFNARTLQAKYNEQAKAFAAAHHLPGTAGSDAHTLLEVGAAYLEMPTFSSAQEFRAALPQAIVRGRRSPYWVHFLTTFNRLRSRLGLKPKL